MTPLGVGMSLLPLSIDSSWDRPPPPTSSPPARVEPLSFSSPGSLLSRVAN